MRVLPQANRDSARATPLSAMRTASTAPARRVPRPPAVGRSHAAAGAACFRRLGRRKVRGRVAARSLAVVAVLAFGGVGFAEIAQDFLLAAAAAQGESHHAVELVVFRRFPFFQGVEIDFQ